MTGPEWTIALHGGAGGRQPDMHAADEADYRTGLAAALEAGASLLRNGGTALHAVEAAVRRLEDDPHFNAGRGAVFSARGRNELDAAIMDGSDLRAGSVAAVTRTRHPISLARAVMEKSEHVMLCGDGADAFSKSQGLEQVDPSYFFTEMRWRELIQELKRQGLPIPLRPRGARESSKAAVSKSPVDRYGTVGAVARDTAGHVAAATSTGGTTAKRWGRIGDSPIIGAGTYASDRSCAVSATGSGEHFIRLTAAREIAALVQYRGMALQASVDEVVLNRLAALGGHGGVIAVDPHGEIAWACNTELMFRAKASDLQAPVIAIFNGER